MMPQKLSVFVFSYNSGKYIFVKFLSNSVCLFMAQKSSIVIRISESEPMGIPMICHKNKLPTLKKIYQEY